MYVLNNATTTTTTTNDNTTTTTTTTNDNTTTTTTNENTTTTTTNNNHSSIPFPPTSPIAPGIYPPGPRSRIIPDTPKLGFPNITPDPLLLNQDPALWYPAQTRNK